MGKYFGNQEVKKKIEIIRMEGWKLAREFSVKRIENRLGEKRRC